MQSSVHEVSVETSRWMLEHHCVLYFYHILQKQHAILLVDSEGQKYIVYSLNKNVLFPLVLNLDIRLYYLSKP